MSSFLLTRKFRVESEHSIQIDAVRGRSRVNFEARWTRLINGELLGEKNSFGPLFCVIAMFLFCAVRWRRKAEEIEKNFLHRLVVAATEFCAWLGVDGRRFWISAESSRNHVGIAQARAIKLFWDFKLDLIFSCNFQTFSCSKCERGYAGNYFLFHFLIKFAKLSSHVHLFGSFLFCLAEQYYRLSRQKD